MSPICLYQNLAQVTLCRWSPAGTAGKDRPSYRSLFLVGFVPAQAPLDPAHNISDRVDTLE